MSKKEAKRKDNKGRVLQKGESQRADNTYMYRWTDALGKRQTIYAQTLNELRDKEFEIERDSKNGLLYSKGSINGVTLVERYLNQKQKLRASTKQMYSSLIKLFLSDSISRVKIRDVKIFMCKEYCERLKQQGYATEYIKTVKRVLYNVFQMAVEDEAILRNPFGFKLDFLENDTKPKEIMTLEEEESFLKFLKDDSMYGYYYDLVVFMLNTGLRCGEVCGLTIKDTDLKQNVVSVDKQLRIAGNKLTVCVPKTNAGYRKVYLNSKAQDALKNIFEKRKLNQEYIIDGYSGFLFYTKSGKVLSANYLSQLVRRICNRYIQCCGEDKTHITAHIFRHTFCTRMVDKGLNIKAVQKVMGHSSVEITLNVYTHKDDEKAVEDMRLIM